MRSCSKKTYEKIASFAKVNDDCMSQENLTVFGVLVGYSQPNMLDDDLCAPNFYWCHPVLKWLLA